MDLIGALFTLVVVWCHQVAIPSGVHFNTLGLLQLTTVQDQRQPIPTPTNRSKRRNTSRYQDEKVRAHHTRSATPALFANEIARHTSPACIFGGTLPTCVYHWTPTTAFVKCGTVCQPSCESRTLHSNSYNKHAKRIYLVTESYSVQWVFLVRCVKISLLTYLFSKQSYKLFHQKHGSDSKSYVQTFWHAFPHKSLSMSKEKQYWPHLTISILLVLVSFIKIGLSQII